MELFINIKSIGKQIRVKYYVISHPILLFTYFYETHYRNPAKLHYVVLIRNKK